MRHAIVHNCTIDGRPGLQILPPITRENSRGCILPPPEGIDHLWYSYLIYSTYLPYGQHLRTRRILASRWHWITVSGHPFCLLFCSSWCGTCLRALSGKRNKREHCSPLQIHFPRPIAKATHMRDDQRRSFPHSIRS